MRGAKPAFADDDNAKRISQGRAPVKSLMADHSGSSFIRSRSISVPRRSKIDERMLDGIVLTEVTVPIG